MKTTDDLSFPPWLWVILGGFLVIAGAVTFKMVQAYSGNPVAPAPALMGESQQPIEKTK